MFLCIFFWEENGYNQATFFLEYFGCSIGEIMTFFVNIEFKYKGISHKKRKNPNRHYFKDFFIMFIILIIEDVVELLSALFENDEEENESSRELYTNDALQIIFITLITYFNLKYKYYIHHFINIALIIILGISFDLILQYFSKTNFITVVISIIYNFAESFVYSYYKYLIEFKYYYFMDILFISGLMNFFVHLCSFSVIFLVQKLIDSNEIIFQFYELYNEMGVWHMVERFLFGLVLNGFIIGIFEFLILDKLTPNFVIISYEIGRIPSSIVLNEGWQRWLVLILSILQLMSLLFYLEIFEFNFCDLNKNTKRNIYLREKAENNTDNDDEITIGDYYISAGFRNQEEMKEIDNETTEEEGK